ncbi:uroporphyrinogen-III decarboxylase-like protein [Candidatus Bathyarchaeota archaeon]|nr:MAG: uroporphyrinogen-III decarboxylase-like protein [Candidatus Bathyarchaeota archaeon]
MFEESMTPKERWLAVLQRRKPDRVPMDYWATPEVTEKLMKHLSVRSLKEMYECLHIDAVITVNPKYIGPPIPEDSDIYGCRYRNIRHRTGTYRECVYHPLANFNSVSEIKRKFEWPTVDLYDYSVIPDQIAGYEDYPIRGGGSEPFLIYKKLRGQKQAFIDLYLHPDIVHYCLDKLFEFCYENTRLIYKEVPGKIMLSYVAEDFGSQTGLLFSPDHIREFFIPRMKKMIDLAHRNGVYVFFHSDGSIRRIIPDMIEAGIDILNPIQWRCKDMDRKSLKRDFGDKVVFHGAMDNQQTLAFGSENDVRREVRENLMILGRDGGYILAPCHNIQPITPIENILAMYDEGYKKGWID